MATVICTIPGGIELSRHMDGPEDGAGRPMRVRRGDPVVLKGGENEVDGEWFAAWLKENELSSFVKSGAIALKKE